MRSKGGRQGCWNGLRKVVLGLGVVMVGVVLWGAGGNAVCWGQENPLDNVHTPAPPPPPKNPETTKPVIEGADNAAKLATSRRDARIRVDVNLVLVPATVTDPMNLLVAGLERADF